MILRTIFAVNNPIFKIIFNFSEWHEHRVQHERRIKARLPPRAYLMTMYNENIVTLYDNKFVMKNYEVTFNLLSITCTHDMFMYLLSGRGPNGERGGGKSVMTSFPFGRADILITFSFATRESFSLRRACKLT